ncbi:MAG: CoA transferase [Deltaproteobacteria bacterium]|nr:CoA transferase [Deltaproteobacteria bacterium]
MIEGKRTMNGGPLEGIRVTEFTSAWAGPYATALLAMLGAEVIKVESRKRPDYSRTISFTSGSQFSGLDASWVYDCLNLNKKCVTLNLSKPRAVDLAKRLVSASDVVAENMRPGVIERLGLGYEALRECKRDVIYLSSSACGQTGPEREYSGYAPAFAAMGGASFITGYEDWPPSTFLGDIDLRSATTAAFAILAALVHRKKSGEGQYIDLASRETIAVMVGDVLLDYTMNGKVQTRRGNREETMAPHNNYRCRGDDRWIGIAVATEDEWLALCRVMGKPELAADGRFSDRDRRIANQEALDRIISDWTVHHDSNVLSAMLQKEGVAAAPCMNSEDLFKDPHLKAREVYQTVEHPVIGKDWVVAPPWRLSETPAAITRHAPLLGEHNDLVFHEMLGMSREEIQALEQEEVIF